MQEVINTVYDRASTGIKTNRAKWEAFLREMRSGEAVEVDEAMCQYWLNVIPPVYQAPLVVTINGVPRRTWFGFAEGSEPVVVFWPEWHGGDLTGGYHYYCQQGKWDCPESFLADHTAAFKEAEQWKVRQQQEQAGDDQVADFLANYQPEPEPKVIDDLGEMQAFLDNDADDEESEDMPKPIFVLNTEDKADWAVGLMAKIEDEKVRLERQHKTRIAELDADYRKLERKFNMALEMFAREEAERRGRRTITLPHGTLKLQRVAGSWIVNDTPEARAKAAEIAPDALREVTEVKFDKNKYKAAALAIMKENGVIEEGLEKTADKDTFKIVFGDDTETKKK